MLDDKRPFMRDLLRGAPLMADHLCDECRAHFDAVRTVLDALDVKYELNPRMVRGLDYYTRTTFEFVHDGLGAQSGMGGGGRYDGLMAELGGPALGGVGFGIGVDRTLLATRSEGLTVVGREPLRGLRCPSSDRLHRCRWRRSRARCGAPASASTRPTAGVA